MSEGSVPFGKLMDSLKIDEALCLLLVCTKPEKLQKTKETRDDMMAPAHTRGAVIPTSFPKVFSGPVHRGVWHTVPRFVYYNTILWMKIRNLAVLDMS